MLHFMISQAAELHELHERLSALRREQLRHALGSNAGEPLPDRDFEAEAESIHDQVHAKYRSREWKQVYPPPAEEEPNAEVVRILTGSRESGMRTMMLLHHQLASLPIVGSQTMAEPEE